MANINSNLDYFDTQVEKNWLNYINLDGITKRYSAKEFYEEMQNDPSERVRAINLINSKVDWPFPVPNSIKIESADSASGNIWVRSEYTSLLNILMVFSDHLSKYLFFIRVLSFLV